MKQKKAYDKIGEILGGVIIAGIGACIMAALVKLFMWIVQL